MTDSYTLTLQLPLSGRNAWFVADYSDPSKPEIDARVRSGDYFILLATAIDTIAAELTEINPAATSLALAKLGEELEYVQRHYSITKKSRSDRSRLL